MSGPYVIGATWTREITLEDADGNALLPSQVEVRWRVSTLDRVPLVTVGPGPTVGTTGGVDAPNPAVNKVYPKITGAQQSAASIAADALYLQEIEVKLLSTGEIVRRAGETLYVEGSLFEE